ncbi:MAG: hypothetical protein IMF01_01595 [Proteobacteria bacterium]|nr:hypothetical protein [Pseudomonadota bacterium]
MIGKTLEEAEKIDESDIMGYLDARKNSALS